MPEELVVPFSGGSSLEGNFTAPYGGMSLDFTYMDRIVDFHEAEYATFYSTRLMSPSRTRGPTRG